MIKKRIKKYLRKISGFRSLTVYRFARRFIEDMKRDCVSLYAAQSAFFAIISAVPFIMLILMCLRYILDVNVTDITGTIYRSFPAPVSTYMSKILSEVFYKSQSTAILSVTVVVLLWTSSRGTMAVYMGINTISGDLSGKSWLEIRLRSFFNNLILIAVLVAAIIVLVFGNTILKLLDERQFAVIHYVLSAVLEMKYILFFVLFVLAFAGVYSYLPKGKLKYKKQLPGAAATAVGWLIFSYGFSIYISHFSRYSFLYGSLAAIVITMFWLYFCLYMLLIGAEINKHIENGFFTEFKRSLVKSKQQKKR